MHDLYAFGIGTFPAKANAELIVHADTPLAGALSLQLLEPVRWRGSEILDTPCEVELLELAQRRTLDIRESGDASEHEQGFGVGAPERLDRHGQNSNAWRD